MGYTTEFTGQFNLDRPLTPEHAEYLRAFAGSRRMQRHVPLAEKLKDDRRIAVGLPIGDEGGYYVGSVDDGIFGQGNDPSVKNHNGPPKGQPELWCKWAPTRDGAAIAWNEAEKFYDYVEWLEYLIAHFLRPWGYVLNGEVAWRGEDTTDNGVIIVENNAIRTEQGPHVRR